MHAEALAVADQASSVFHSDNGREAVLPRDPSAMSDQTAHLRRQAFDRNE